MHSVLFAWECSRQGMKLESSAIVAMLSTKAVQTSGSRRTRLPVHCAGPIYCQSTGKTEVYVPNNTSSKFFATKRLDKQCYKADGSWVDNVCQQYHHQLPSKMKNRLLKDGGQGRRVDGWGLMKPRASAPIPTPKAKANRQQTTVYGASIGDDCNAFHFDFCHSSVVDVLNIILR